MAKEDVDLVLTTCKFFLSQVKCCYCNVVC